MLPELEKITIKDISQIQVLLSRISYKPNFRFEARANRNDYSDGYIYAVYRVQDVHNPGFTIPVSYAHSLRIPCDAEFVLYVCAQLIEKLERHETDEWFKFDGKCVREPHPKVHPKVEL